VSNVGIKHFQSNRILLRDQGQSFDPNHRVLIIPIMELNGVKALCGEMYDAIVLVSDESNDGHEIYQRIEAGSGTLRFATEDECKIARALLESMILCVCKSFQETFEIYFPRRRRPCLSVTEAAVVPLLLPNSPFSKLVAWM
jgi:hypothetical protein